MVPARSLIEFASDFDKMGFEVQLEMKQDVLK